MGTLILLVVGAAWMAVLLPPLMRSRFDGGSATSVSDFRRQLHTLQRTQAPRAQAPMRSMARPLAPAQSMRQPVRPGMGRAPMARPQGFAQPGRAMQDRTQMMRQQARPAARTAPQGAMRPRLVEDQPRHRRSHHTAELSRHHFAPEEMFLSPREIVRRRRTNALYGLLAVNGISLFLAFTTGSTAMVYFFGVAAIALTGYCYTLVQIRNQEHLRRYYSRRAA